MVIAKWNGMQFEVSASAIKSFRDLNYSLEVQYTEKTSSKQSYIALKSRKPRTISLKVPIHKAAGVDVRAEIDNWMAKAHSAGKDYFYLGGKKLVPCKLMLTKVEVTETGIAPGGEIVTAVLGLSFTQCAKIDAASGTSSNSSKKKKKTTKKASAKKATSTTKNTATSKTKGTVSGTLTKTLITAQQKTKSIVKQAKQTSAKKTTTKKTATKFATTAKK